MLQEKLKLATAPYHDELERLMFVNDIMGGTLTADLYKKLLVTNYLSHQYFEEFIFSNLSQGLQQALNISQRVKLGALAKDIEQLSIATPTMPEGLNLTPIAADDASFLGAMYVLEGATLGGNVIVKRLLTNPHLQPLGLNYYYYQVYGAQLIDKWKQFCQVLNTSVASADEDKAVKSAVDMFNNMIALGKSVL